MPNLPEIVWAQNSINGCCYGASSALMMKSRFGKVMSIEEEYCDRKDEM